MGDTYGATSINIEQGKGTAGSASPRIPGVSTSTNRHCTAWEQTNQAVNLICDALESLGYGDTQPIRKAILEAKMERTRGE